MKRISLMKYIQEAILIVLLISIVFLPNDNSFGQEFERWPVLGAKEIPDDMERLERGYYNNTGVAEFSYVLPGEIRLDVPPSYAEFVVKEISDETEKQLHKELSSILNHSILPDNLDNFMVYGVESNGDNTESYGEFSKAVLLSYTVTQRNKRDYVRILWTDKYINGFITCDITAITPDEIEKTARKIFSLNLKNKKIKHISVKGSIKDGSLKKNLEYLQYNENLVFPRTIQLEYPEYLLKLRGGSYILQIRSGANAEDYSAIAFVKYNNESQFKAESSHKV